MRTVYPKLVIDAHGQIDPGQYQMTEAGVAAGLAGVTVGQQQRPPLARAVHLTLGVAILGRYMHEPGKMLIRY